MSAGVQPTEYLEIMIKHGYHVYSELQGGVRIMPQDIATWAKASHENNGDIRFVLMEKEWPPQGST